jgi:hypothetical protein
MFVKLFEAVFALKVSKFEKNTFKTHIDLCLQCSFWNFQPNFYIIKKLANGLLKRALDIFTEYETHEPHLIF